MSFFDDAFAIPQTFGAGLTSPLDLAQTPKKLDLLAEIDQINDADPDEEEEVVPADDPKQMLSCNKIWYSSSPFPTLYQQRCGVELRLKQVMEAGIA